MSAIGVVLRANLGGLGNAAQAAGVADLAMALSAGLYTVSPTLAGGMRTPTTAAAAPALHVADSAAARVYSR